jgi:glycosidase
MRQYSAEGNFQSFQSHLPRLAKMGVSILWFMPLTPISLLKRKGKLGSYYACSSYQKINPDYGSEKEFVQIVKTAHGLGMKVIVDWVANHTGADHDWRFSNPEFYKKNDQGNFYDAHGWDDVIDLDYSNDSLRKEMIHSMRYWVEKFDIDGFRCDMAMLTPVHFWYEARLALEPQKKMFWLAELDPLDNPEYMSVFDSAYTWRWMNACKQFKDSGARDISSLLRPLSLYLQESNPSFCPAWFTSNHDENSWNGTEFEKYGEMVLPLTIFSATFKGIHLMYSGQEIPNLKRLQFFDKDPLKWPEIPQWQSLFTSLNKLRNQVTAFQCSASVQNCQLIQNSVAHHVVSFIRKSAVDEVLVLINFSSYTLNWVEIEGGDLAGDFTEWFTKETRYFDGRHHAYQLEEWGSQIWIKKRAD